MIDEFAKIRKSNVDILKFIIENKEELYNLVRHVTWEDIMNGRIILTEDIVNKEIKPVILNVAGKYVKRLDIFLKDEAVLAYLKGYFMGIPFEGNYTIKFDEFEFNPQRHLIILDYKEKISEIMNIDNKFILMPIRALVRAMLKKPFIELVLNNQAGITFDKNKIIVDLDEIPKLKDFCNREFTKTLLSLTRMELLSCNNGKIVFKASTEFTQDEQEIAATI